MCYTWPLKKLRSSENWDHDFKLYTIYILPDNCDDNVVTETQDIVLFSILYHKYVFHESLSCLSMSLTVSTTHLWHKPVAYTKTEKKAKHIYLIYINPITWDSFSTNTKKLASTVNKKVKHDENQRNIYKTKKIKFKKTSKTEKEQDKTIVNNKI